jgi:hypothetical protein
MLQQVNDRAVTDSSTSYPVGSSGTQTAATLVSGQLPEDKKNESKATTVAGAHVQTPSSVPAQDAGKNAFGLKPEYKTALRDFFVRIFC